MLPQAVGYCGAHLLFEVNSLSKETVEHWSLGTHLVQPLDVLAHLLQRLVLLLPGGQPQLITAVVIAVQVGVLPRNLAVGCDKIW